MSAPALGQPRRGRRRAPISPLAALPQSKLIATDELKMLPDLSPRVAVLDAGRVVADGPALEILPGAALMEHHRPEVSYSLRRDHEHRLSLPGPGTSGSTGTGAAQQLLPLWWCSRPLIDTGTRCP